LKRALIVSVVFLAVGVGLIFGFCNGTTGFSFAYPLSGASLHIDITTTGVPALLGVALTVIGAMLLAIAWLLAFVRQKPLQPETPSKRREEPFKE
jgi:hypothetical protein